MLVSLHSTLPSGRGGATTHACSPLAPPLLCSSLEGTFELQGHLALSLPPHPPGWQQLPSSLPSTASAAAFGSVELAAEAAAQAGDTLEEKGRREQ